MKRSSFLLLALFLASLATGCPAGKRGGAAHEGPTAGHLPTGRLQFENGTALDIEIAATGEATRIGLSYRESLCEFCGLYFVFPETRIQNFWMRQMRFPIDILWIAGGKVVGISENLPAPAPGTPEPELPHYESPEPVRHVLEVNAGFAKRHGIEVGTTLSVSQ